MPGKTRLLIASSGAGHIQRGFETFSEDLFVKLSNTQQFEVLFAKGAKAHKKGELLVFCLKRSGYIAKFLAWLLAKNPYYVQSLTFGIGLISAIRKQKPEVLYIGEPLAYRVLNRFRKWLPANLRIIFFVGGQNVPHPLNTKDTLQLVTPEFSQILSSKLPAEKRKVIPHFIEISNKLSLLKASDQDVLKQRLKIPLDAKVILSVGALDKQVKRMDFLLQELSTLKGLFPVLLGQEESETDALRSLAQLRFPKSGCLIKTVSRLDLYQYYQVADLFILASLREGFGIVYVEAMSYGLPVLAHDFEVSRYVLGNHGHLADFSQKGSIARLVRQTLDHPMTNEEKNQQHTFAYDRYSWQALSKNYTELISKA